MKNNNPDELTVSYLKSLGAKPALTMSKIDSLLKKSLGIDGAHQIYDQMNRRCIEARERGGSKDFEMELYEFKNASYERSLAMTLVLDYRFLRNFCPWIVRHSDLFSGTVLDFGCDNGVLSCFLAQVMPDVRFVVVDRCEQALAHARTLADNLELKNVQFKKSDDIVSEKFDAIFASRVFQENLDADLAGFLVPLLKENGTLISSVRSPVDDVYRGILSSVEKAGAKWQDELHEQICLDPIDIHNAAECFQIDVARRI